MSRNDIVTAIKKLKVLGNGFGLVTIGHQELVRSVPGELNQDKNKVLEVAQVDNDRIADIPSLVLVSLLQFCNAGEWLC